MATDGFGTYQVRVTDSVLGTTVLMYPLDAKETLKNGQGRFTVLDPLIQPLPPTSLQTLFLTVAPFLGSFLIANLPVVLPAAFGGGAIPAGSTAIVTNGQTAPVLGAVPSTTGAVTCEVVWNGAAWGYG